MDARFCVEALNEALARYGRPEIFNTDQGSQFTSLDFTDVLKNADVAISMDGRGRCMDNRAALPAAQLSSASGGRSSTRRSTCTS
jgi:putative transposase